MKSCHVSSPRTDRVTYDTADLYQSSSVVPSVSQDGVWTCKEIVTSIRTGRMTPRPCQRCEMHSRGTCLWGTKYAGIGCRATSRDLTCRPVKV